MKQKILYIITKSNWGGAGRYVFDMATNLPENYIPVVALGGNGTLKTALEKKNIKTISLKSLKRDISIFKDLKTFFNLLKILKEEKPNTAHINSSKIGGLGGLAIRIHNLSHKKNKVKIIWTAHGWAFNESRNKMSKMVILFLHWVTILLSHKTIAVSYKTKEQISFLPFIKNKIVVIYNGIDSFETLPKEITLKKIFDNNIPTHINNETIIIGTISELHKNKGLDMLIKSINKLEQKVKHLDFKKYTVVIIGDGEEKECLNKLIRKYDLENKVYLVGYKEQARKLLSAIDIFTLTSRTEALPYVLLEVGIQSKSILATKVGGIPEIIKDRVTGFLVEKNNTDEVAERLYSILSHREYTNHLAKNLNKHILKNFTLKNMVQKTTEIY